MTCDKSSRIPSLEEVGSRFERWRRTRQGKAPIPEELWSAAAAVARRDGVNPTAVALHLDGGKLKRRMAAAGRSSRKAPPAAFVELLAPSQRALAPTHRSTLSNWKVATGSCGSLVKRQRRPSWPPSAGRFGTWPVDPDRPAVPHPGGHRGGGWPQGDRRVSAVMPGETRRRPVFRLCLHLPHAPPNRHQIIGIRRPGILDRHQALVERAFPLVAHGRGAGANAARPPGTDATRRRQPGGGSAAGVATVDSLKKFAQRTCVPVSALPH